MADMADSKRYVARLVPTGRFQFWMVYDTQTRSMPVYLGLRRLSVPQSFASAEAAQEWADEHLNGEEK